MTPRALGPALVGAGATLVLLVGGGVVHLERSDRSTAYDEDAAVAAFRSADPAAEPLPPAPPTPSAAVVATAVPTRAAAGPRASTQAAPAPAPRRTSAPAAAAPAPESSGSRPAPAPAGAAPRSARREVQPGVYRYATSGHEEVDALGGARHDYPSTTTVTYARTACGTQERWQPLRERYGVVEQCASAAGRQVRSTLQSREFFGRRETKTYRCDPGVLLLPAAPRPGQTWTGRCTEQGSAVRLDGRVVGLERLDVGGTAVEVVHVRIEGTATGSVRGATDREVWLARDTGLLVQALGETDTEADTAGGVVRYRESYRLRLTSLAPRR